MARVNIDKLVELLPLGAGHEAQEKAVAAALRSLLVEDRRGVVLADEVGFGKTYEALAVMTLLCEHARRNGESFRRVLVLCQSSLLRKWQEELSSARKDRGFPRYLSNETWRNHPVQTLLNAVRVVSHRQAATMLRNEGIRGQQEDGTVQVPQGIWVVNHDVLGESSRNGNVSRPLLRQLWRTRWDLIIVDEAHHYARWNKPALLFAPDGNMRNYDQGISDGEFGRLLALTATPFELTPRELVTLLGMIRADPDELTQISKGLELFVDGMDRFFGLRQRGPDDALRREAVERLRRLREEDAAGVGRRGVGLQALLRRYLIRNTKSQNERRYHLVNKTPAGYSIEPFEKLDDLHERVRRSALLPFDGMDTLFYLELRELIQETVEEARKGNEHRTFITTDLRQGLSSYEQIARSKLLERDMEAARRLKTLVDEWNRPRTLHLHPKVRAMTELAVELARQEVQKVREDPQRWFSKILVFNKLITGTATQLHAQMEAALEPVFEDFLTERIEAAGLGTRDALVKRVRDRTREHLDAIKRRLAEWKPEHHRVPDAFTHEAFARRRGKSFVDVYRDTVLKRVGQTLFLLHAVLDGEAGSDESLSQWLQRILLEPFEKVLQRIIDDYLADEPREGVEEATRFEQAEREAVVLLEEWHAGDLVGRFDGVTQNREAQRRTFNSRYNPFVLLVSRVGEEGIDLQEQCRYIIHYDLEWNPAKMEQREGRVDRIGWGRADEGYIDVRFLLLKGTYEERIFHTVMQRDQWFQVLIGSKRRELGKLDEESEGASPEPDEGSFSDEEERGRLTPEEKNAVMIDLRP